MEYRKLGRSGLKIPVLSLGTGTFGGTDDFFQKWGQTGAKEASRLIDICLERGVNFVDTANVYSAGDAEKVLGKAIQGRREKMILSTKATFKMGEGPNDHGSSRSHIINACEDSLRRLDTDHIDVYFMHGYDPTTPVEETLSTLDHLVSSGKIRYIGCSNFTAWQLMKSLSVSEKHHLQKYVIYQGYYSLIGRDYEQELMPLLRDQELGLMVWSPLGWGRLTGKLKKGGPLPEGRVGTGGLTGAPPVSDELLFNVLAALEEISAKTGKTVPQIALNWLLQNETVSNVIIGARTEQQLLSNLDAVDWKLPPELQERLNKVSYQDPIYPHWVGAR